MDLILINISHEWPERRVLGQFAAFLHRTRHHEDGVVAEVGESYHWRIFALSKIVLECVSISIHIFQFISSRQNELELIV